VFNLEGWETRHTYFTCQGEYPYATFSYSYTQTGYASVSSVSAIFAETPQTVGVLWTNWNPFQTDTVTVNFACSKVNAFGDSCGGPVSDPGCPVVAGSTQNHCNSGPVPVCILTYQERCSDNQLYQCTGGATIPYCQKCPG